MAAHSKPAILERLRRTKLEPCPLPELDGPWTQYADPRQQFADVLTAVGGRAMVVRDTEHLNTELGNLSAYRDALQVCSRVPGVARANVSSEAADDPHALEDVDYFVAAGEFAVAENAAVWVTDQSLRHRVLYFLCQHMALVVPANELVHNMHEAYRRLSFDRPQFGLFISGPSKTADIEQSLVIGAHGPRSLTVFLMESN